MLAEYLFFSLFVWYVYSAEIEYLDFEEPPRRVVSSSSVEPIPAKNSLYDFSKDVFAVYDIFYEYDMTVTNADPDLISPLTNSIGAL